MKFKKCNIEACTNHAQQGGVCLKHEAKHRPCSSEGCTNQAQQGGVCVSSAVQRSTDTNALQMDAQIKLNKEECV